MLAVPARPAAARIIVAARCIACGQIHPHVLQRLQQFLLQFRRIVHLEGAVVILDDAVGRLSPVALLDQQAVGGQLQDVGGVGLIGSKNLR